MVIVVPLAGQALHHVGANVGRVRSNVNIGAMCVMQVGQQLMKLNININIKHCKPLQGPLPGWRSEGQPPDFGIFLDGSKPGQSHAGADPVTILQVAVKAIGLLLHQGVAELNKEKNKRRLPRSSVRPSRPRFLLRQRLL